ncbi:unnamed protein product [Ostreobium quekettii]|uniref:CNNM transmembrane domain-containing protein n=1 Tax=Ostreobium quekettii TaxID=121088 RepID=A0A8S1IXI8_9CHLO|nr:unnamed protein product [Ostreobium quekettii]|eukprot:evm.model.scf_19.5 EVM.evm.TU.scf_19.5   scf_19:96058-113386(-)
MPVEEGCLASCCGGADVVACAEGCFRAGGWAEADGGALTAGLSGGPALGLGAALLVCSGMFSGLTLGLLSLDMVGLRILEQAGQAEEQKYAKAIIPVRQHGNLLLCTMLLGNVIVNSALSILLSDLTSGLVGLIVSTIVILIFGEIVPQAVCSRHGLMIGAYCIWPVRFFMVLFLPVTWPMSKVLDWMLGRYVGTIYSKDEIKRLIDIHAEDPEAQRECGLTTEDHKMLIGALELQGKTVRNVMTPLDQIYMLDKNTKLNFEKLSEIYKTGFSRIPVYLGNCQTIVGILFVKDLVLVDPDDEIELGKIMSLRGHTVGHIYEDLTLDKILKIFISSSSHQVIVHRRPPATYGKELTSGGLAALAEGAEGTEVTGLITLEDVIEEVLQDEIIDETDNLEMAGTGGIGEQGRKGSSATSEFLQFFDHKLHGEKLSQQEVKAITSFLISNEEEFAEFAGHEETLAALIRGSKLLEVNEQVDCHTPMGGDVPKSRLLGGSPVDGQMIYEDGKSAREFTLVLQGKVLIRTGMEEFTLEIGPWSTLGNKALANTALEQYVPDFDAQAVAPCRLLCIHWSGYQSALGAARRGGSSSAKEDSPFVHAKSEPGGRPTNGRIQPGACARGPSKPVTPEPECSEERTAFAIEMGHPAIGRLPQHPPGANGFRKKGPHERRLSRGQEVGGPPDPFADVQELAEGPVNGKGYGWGGGFSKHGGQYFPLPCRTGIGRNGDS